MNIKDLMKIFDKMCEQFYVLDKQKPAERELRKTTDLNYGDLIQPMDEFNEPCGIPVGTVFRVEKQSRQCAGFPIPLKDRWLHINLV